MSLHTAGSRHAAETRNPGPRRERQQTRKPGASGEEKGLTGPNSAKEFVVLAASSPVPVRPGGGRNLGCAQGDQEIRVSGVGPKP